MATTTDTILFNVSAFLAGLFLLERCADAFVDTTVLLAMRLGVSQTLIALLTAGAEWEELVVVVASLLQKRPGLAVGNVLGSCVGNVLGAFGVGLLVVRPFGEGRVVVRFDGSAKGYSGVLVGVTSLVVGGVGVSVGGGGEWAGRGAGVVLVGGFGVYVGVVCWSIYRGVLDAPVGEDSGLESDSDVDEAENGLRPRVQVIEEENDRAEHDQITESTSLLPTSTSRRHPTSTSHPILTPLLKLLFSLLALSMSGYILAHTSYTLARALGIQDSVFGATVLSLATTLPEKFIAVLSGRRGHSGILVANTVGSNIFLLTLCLGVVLCAGGGVQAVTVAELGWVWGSAVGLGVVVVVGANWVVGVVMLVAYLAFLVLEFTGYGG